MDKSIEYLTEPTQRIMKSAFLVAKQQGRGAPIPVDVFRALTESSEGSHLRILVDGLKVDMNGLREAVKNWEFKGAPEEDWICKFLLLAAKEATLATSAYVSTEHLLFALVQMWPEAPCSQIILRAGGGSIHELRHRLTFHW